MIYFLPLAVIGLWLLASTLIAKRILRGWREQPWRLAAAPLVFLILVVGPVTDEIIGGFQFRALCRENAVFRLGVEKPEGRVTRYVANPENEVIAKSPLKIYHSKAKYIDIRSDEVVVEFDEYFASGGVVVRTLTFSDLSNPITFKGSRCSPTNVRGKAATHTFKFSAIN